MIETPIETPLNTQFFIVGLENPVDVQVKVGEGREVFKVINDKRYEMKPFKRKQIQAYD